MNVEIVVPKDGGQIWGSSGSLPFPNSNEIYPGPVLGLGQSRVTLSLLPFPR